MYHSMIRKIGVLILGDWKNISRDTILVFTLVGPVILTVVFRYGTPLLTAFLAETPGFDLRPYYPFMAGFLALLPTLMFGTTAGYLLLDERDDEILSYMAVTPLSRSGYLFYRLSLPVALSFFFCFVILGLTGLVRLSLFEMIPVSVVVALEGPLLALVLAAFAGNKVEGLALAKGFGVLFAGPVIGYFAPAPWRFLGGIFPPYWPTLAVVEAAAGSATFGWYVAGGVVVHLVVIWWMWGRFKVRAG